MKFKITELPDLNLWKTFQVKKDKNGRCFTELKQNERISHSDIFGLTMGVDFNNSDELKKIEALNINEMFVQNNPQNVWTNPDGWKTRMIIIERIS